jgi:small-conductance mechanosensitive channel
MMEELDLSYEHIWGPVTKGVNNVLPQLPKALVALLAGLILIKLVGVFARVVLRLWRMPQGLRAILLSLITGMLWVFLVISVLQALGLNNIALALSGSVALLGIALATGAQSLTADILAGIFLAKDKDFSVGDEVRAGDGTEGTVETMDMRRTRIRDKDGKLHVIPNSVIERKEWVLLAAKPTKPRVVRRAKR